MTAKGDANSSADIVKTSGNGDSSAAEPSLLVEDLVVDRGEVQVLNGVTFSAQSGHIMGVIGPNGAGKSTLFNTLTGLLPAREGRVLICGKSIQDSQGSVAFVPQRQNINWDLPMTVWDMVMLGRTRRIGWFRRPGRADREAVEDALNQVWMWDRRNSLISELSGGQQQRIFIARALAQGVDVLILDEAFRGVDFTSQEVMTLVLQEMRDAGKTILLASHNISYIRKLTDECLCLNRSVVACGPTAEVLVPDVMEELYRSVDIYRAYESEQN
ncbi:MAG: metal ABC transporter ATP-binding protein [Chloroflexota bacterium]|nr:metal ABC transporter ATP-binding protein [Chloroflexota bacterium]MDE2840027.1 metal ABC transporter ATP-binding protein [Chloroflexota bacterium]MDE2929453.1 metal ABC transporter ATP-binding protein [Chloroflexota bacterium]